MVDNCIDALIVGCAVVGQLLIVIALVLHTENQIKMAKYNHSRKVRKNRRWYQNVGDGAKLSKDNLNPNDKPKK